MIAGFRLFCNFPGMDTSFILCLQLSDQVLDVFLSFQELQDVILQSEAVRFLSWAQKTGYYMYLNSFWSPIEAHACRDSAYTTLSQVIECFKVENGVHEVIEKRFHHGHCQSHHAVSLLVDDAPLVGFLTSKSMGGNARMKLYWQTTSLYIYMHHACQIQN